MRRAVIIAAGVLLLGLIGLSRSPALLMRLATTIERGRAGLSEHTDGGAGEVILMVHGFNADKDNWTRMAAGLTGQYRVIALDLPGFGQSSRDPALRYDTTSQADRLKALHDALGLSAVHLVGNSMGGEISGVYAVRYPQDVATLTLVDAAGVRSPQPSQLNQLVAQGKNPLIASNAAEYSALLDFVFEEKPWVPDVVLAHFAQIAIDNRDFTERIWADLHSHPSGLEAHLSEIAAPTLVLWGDSDRVLDVSMASVFDAGIPDSTVVIMPRTGHGPMLERPEESAAILREFLASRTAQRTSR